MAPLQLIFAIAISSYVLLINSCIQVPVEFTLARKLAWTTEELTDITGRIQTKLVSSLTFSNESCRKAFGKWLKKHVDTGLIPRRVLEGAEYAIESDEATRPLCDPIDLAQEYPITAEQVIGDEDKNTLPAIITTESLKKSVGDYKCADRFLEPEQNKWEITSIWLHVETNHLNSLSPSFVIYSSNKILKTKDFEKEQSKQDYIDNGTLKEMARAPKVPPHSVGEFEIAGWTKTAAQPLYRLHGTLVAFLDYASIKPDIKVIDGNEYFVVPKGDFSASVRFKLLFKGDPQDAICAYYDALDKIRKAENERRSQSF